VIQNLNILLVDDTKTNRIIGKKILEKLDANVMLAESGEEAIEVCRNNRFNLIFMDIEMPGLNGFETAHILREEKISYAPIVAVSGHDSEKMKEACHNAQMTGYLTKPLKLETIQKVIDRLFRT